MTDRSAGGKIDSTRITIAGTLERAATLSKAVRVSRLPSTAEKSLHPVLLYLSESDLAIGQEK